MSSNDAFFGEAPTTDTEYVQGMRAFAQQLTGYAGQMEEYQATLLERVGLDSSCVSQLGRASEAMTEAANGINDAVIDFMTTYEGVIETVSNGTKLPGNSFFTGDVS